MMADLHNYFTVLLACVISCCMYGRVACDTSVSSNGVYTKVLGQSGKIMVGRTSNPANDPNSIVITFDAIKEIDSNNVTVGQSGQNKHSFQTFASQSFSFSSIREAQYENISAKTFTFSTMIPSVTAEIVVDVYIFLEDGNITNGDEVTSVSPGNVKFNIQINNWTFCGGSDGVECRKGQTKEVGSFLDFEIEIKGKQTPMKNTNETNRGNGDSFDFGGNASLILSRKVQYDNNGEWVDLPGNYPAFETVGNKQMFVFRYARFNNSVLYDPTVKLDEFSSGSSNENGNGTDVGSVASFSLFVLLFSVIMQQLSVLMTNF